MQACGLQPSSLDCMQAYAYLSTVQGLLDCEQMCPTPQSRLDCMQPHSLQSRVDYIKGGLLG